MRPHVSNDNPYSESAFKTLKYRPRFPDRFGSEQDARAHCRRVFDWYNHEHRHGGLGLSTPNEVHCGLAAETRERRSATLDAAFLAHPERFPRGRPLPPSIPTEVTWLSKLTNGVSHTR
ncbi:Mobile element protein [Labilithrix luteola]|uniref:Mobile element protein n=1 Tax=Labilithrix luteola TaxID=1391654 RepID=A0A0K1QFZ8_9BACT|nr:Mobile element protein [Labilithrix luteola]